MAFSRIPDALVPVVTTAAELYLVTISFSQMSANFISTIRVPNIEYIFFADISETFLAKIVLATNRDLPFRIDNHLDFRPAASSL
jgi:hypothetical protein